MMTGTIHKKWEQLQSKDLAHYALFNSVIATLAGAGFVVFFHLVNAGSDFIFNEPGEYISGCAGIFAGSAISSCFGWKLREDTNQEGEVNGKV